MEAMIGGSSFAIEQQEARGQTDFIYDEILPTEGLDKEVFESLGGSVGEKDDDLFTKVSLPEGWAKKRTDHSMHNDLLDGQGRKRAGIFYKAAFYDRAAHMHFTKRYTHTYQPVGGEYLKENQAYEAVVKDCGVVIVTLGKTEVEPEYNSSTDGEEVREVWLAWLKTRKNLQSLGKEYLDKNYPEWQDVTAYWDGE